MSVVVAGVVGLSHGTLVGIIVGILLMLLLLLTLVVMATLAVRRRRHKSHPPIQSTSSAVTAVAGRCASSRSTTSVSTISMGNGVLPTSFSGMPLAPAQQWPVRDIDNVGYVHRDEPPPPYSSVSGSPLEPHQRPVSTRTGRSLPPTPLRPLPPAALGRPRDSLSEHIYDEPSMLFQNDTRPAATLAAYPRSSMSRIRLGTTALRPGGTLRTQSPRQRPRDFGGTHHPRRFTQISELSNADPSCSTSHSPPPFFISNFTTCPSETDGVGSPNVDPPGGMLAYATATPLSVSPRLASELRSGVYDEPWDSGSVMSAIPLTAIPPRSTTTLNGARRYPSPQSGWAGSDLTAPREPYPSPDWSGLPPDGFPGDVFHGTAVSDWPHHPGAAPYLGRSQHSGDLTNPSRSVVLARGSGRSRTLYHPRADSSDSGGTSSSSPLVSGVPNLSRHGRDNSEILDLLSPTCV